MAKVVCLIHERIMSAIRQKVSKFYLYGFETQFKERAGQKAENDAKKVLPFLLASSKFWCYDKTKKPQISK